MSSLIDTNDKYEHRTEVRVVLFGKKESVPTFEVKDFSYRNSKYL